MQRLKPYFSRYKFLRLKTMNMILDQQKFWGKGVCEIKKTIRTRISNSFSRDVLWDRG